MVGDPDLPGDGTAHRRRRLDVRVVPHRRRSPFRLRDWRMRTKLAAVLIIPSAAFLVLAGTQTAALIGRTGTLSEFARQVAIGQEITALVHELQQERDRTAGELAGARRSPGGGSGPQAIETALGPLYERTDAAIDRLRSAAEPRATADAAWRVSYARVGEVLNQLPGVRGAAPVTGLSAQTVLGGYQRTIDALLALLAEPSAGADQPELTGAVLRYVQFARIKEISSQVRAQLYASARSGRYDVDDLVGLGELRTQQLTALADFRSSATVGQLRRYEQLIAGPDFLAATRMEEDTIVSGSAQPAVLPADDWWSVSERRQELLRQVEQSVLRDAVELAESTGDVQLRRTLLTAAAVLAVLLAALFTSVVIGRSIARSLRALRTQALRVAQIELPEALEQLRTLDARAASIEVPPAVVRSLDEIGEVAEAFVAVHRSAVSVAAEQAAMRRNVNAMFVNLARRSQVLVERQLELLDELEREESDPDQLDNLFKLDHLAARMRRNDDSLLVLAGTESGRRWPRPALIGSVLLAAVAEIEQYQRVRQISCEAFHIVGHAVADLVHLLAELLENATAFSRPDTVVQVTARLDTPGSALVEIRDAGLGMSPSALAEANELLATPPAADVAASERMGLFVVSHLAARQGIRVRLAAAEPGLVAQIRLPASVIAPTPSQDVELPQTRRRLAVLGVDAGAVPVRAVTASSDDTLVLPSTTGRSTLRRPARRAMPTRAEDVLAPVAGQPSARQSTWWSRPEKSTGSGSSGQPGAVRPYGAPVTAGRPADPPVAGQAPPYHAPAATGEPDRRWGTPSGSGIPPQVDPHAVTPQPRSAPHMATAPVAAPSPAGPVTGGVGRGGLPIRVPMAQLPMATQPAVPTPVTPRVDLDPEAVGGMLSRYYSGVRRAEAEEATTEMSAPPLGARSEKELS